MNTPTALTQANMMQPEASEEGLAGSALGGLWEMSRRARSAASDRELGFLQVDAPPDLSCA